MAADPAAALSLQPGSPQVTEIIALLPAHNEVESIRRAVENLFAQTVPPARIIAVADNCTDDTAAIARDAGAEVGSAARRSDRAGSDEQCQESAGREGQPDLSRHGQPRCACWRVCHIDCRRET